MVTDPWGQLFSYWADDPKKTTNNTYGMCESET